MSETATKLLEQLLVLPESERLQIAERLWDSLGDEKKQEIMDETTDDPTFQAELQRRLDSVANGTAELVDGEQVFREARERLQKRRKS
jgi:putative addiction module component (TIGR02574 family)